MADYTPLDINTLLPGKPVTSAKALAFYENPIAIAEGATGAPLISGALTKIIEGEEIGAFVFATGPSGTEYGDIVAGSNLNYAGVLSSIAGDAGDTAAGGNQNMHSFSYSSGQGASLSGSWMCLGEINNTSSVTPSSGNTSLASSSTTGATMWQRVA